MSKQDPAERIQERVAAEFPTKAQLLEGYDLDSDQTAVVPYGEPDEPITVLRLSPEGVEHDRLYKLPSDGGEVTEGYVAHVDQRLKEIGVPTDDEDMDTCLREDSHRGPRVLRRAAGLFFAVVPHR